MAGRCTVVRLQVARPTLVSILTRRTVDHVVYPISMKRTLARYVVKGSRGVTILEVLVVLSLRRDAIATNFIAQAQRDQHL